MSGLGQPERLRRLVLSTRNPHKLAELSEILLDCELLPLPPQVELPPEDGLSFSANALIKARAARAATGLAAIADDSGIVARALGTRPGIHSARFAGPAASDAANLAKLIAALRDHDDRSVAYVCALAYIDENGVASVFEARCEGDLIDRPRGDGGFGYDPAFVPRATGPEDRRTMAELSAPEKHAISHRGTAARKLSNHLAATRSEPITRTLGR